jgi:hypothetical protein
MSSAGRFGAMTIPRFTRGWDFDALLTQISAQPNISIIVKLDRLKQ